MVANLIVGLVCLLCAFLNLGLYFYPGWQERQRDKIEAASRTVKFEDTSIEPNQPNRPAYVRRYRHFEDGRREVEYWRPFIRDDGQPDLMLYATQTTPKKD